MKAINRLFLIISFLSFSSSIFAKADWTFLIYAQTKNDLNVYFLQNLRDMAQVGSNDRLNIIVQWEQPKRDGIWRYKVEKGKVHLDQHLANSANNGCVNDVVDFARWGVSKYPAKHYAFILSSHGSGIIDPTFWKDSLGFNVTKLDETSRGILFNWENKSYMTNQHLSQTLKQIKNDILGKKLELLIMDACLMSTVEMQYQVKDYANFFVGSEEQSSAIGLTFSDFFRDLANKYLTPFELSALMVNTYKQYYEEKFDWYTQSAVNLEDVSLIKDNLDQIVLHITECEQAYGKSAVKNFVKRARKSCLQFNVPIYVDLHSFYSSLYAELQNGILKEGSESNDMFSELYFGEESLDLAYTLSLIEDPEFENYLATYSDFFEDNQNCENQICNLDNLDQEMLTSTFTKTDLTNTTSTKSISQDTKSNLVEKLKNDLIVGMKLIESSVVASVSGSSMSKAKGLSIYYPKNRVIDASYLKTEFAKDSLWLDFLKEHTR
jgi:hypothetical protein